MLRICDIYNIFFFLMIRRPPRSTLDRSSAASDVYKRQVYRSDNDIFVNAWCKKISLKDDDDWFTIIFNTIPVSYTHLRAHETVLDLVCRLLLENTKNNTSTVVFILHYFELNLYSHN